MKRDFPNVVSAGHQPLGRVLPLEDPLRARRIVPHIHASKVVVIRFHLACRGILDKLKKGGKSLGQLCKENVIMRLAFRHLGFMLLGLVLAVSTLAAQDKDKDKKDSKDAPDQKEKLIQIGNIEGKIKGIDAMEKSLNLQSGRQNVKVMTIDEVKVRTKNPPIQYDDKGNKKKYTAKELKDLKGDSKLPGYTAEFGDLKTNQYVQITLVRKKSDKAAKQPLASVILIANQAN
jgi:hypothetical protein